VPSPDLPRARARRRPLVVWASLLASTAFAQPAPALQPVPALQPPPGGSDVRGQAPVYLRADRLGGQLQATVAAQGAVEMRHAGIVIRADELRYDLAEDLAVAEGRVRISFDGSVVRSPKVEL
jgi:LPS-assembly protein